MVGPSFGVEKMATMLTSHSLADKLEGGECCGATAAMVVVGLQGPAAMSTI